MIKYAAIIDIGAGDGWVNWVDTSDAWTPENPHGWTYQELCAPFGTWFGLHDSKEEAWETINNFLGEQK
jgi:hypothetical protein